MARKIKEFQQENLEGQTIYFLKKIWPIGFGSRFVWHVEVFGTYMNKKPATNKWFVNSGGVEEILEFVLTKKTGKVLKERHLMEIKEEDIWKNYIREVPQEKYLSGQ